MTLVTFSAARVHGTCTLAAKNGAPGEVDV
jgi:hypothetical protein